MDLSQYYLIWEYMQPELLLLVATILLFFVDLFASPRFLDKWFSGIACVLLAAQIPSRRNVAFLPKTQTDYQ